MESIKQKEEEALAQARAKAATRIAAMQRGRKAREQARERELAATRLQALHRGRTAGGSRPARRSR